MELLLEATFITMRNRLPVGLVEVTVVQMVCATTTRSRPGVVDAIAARAFLAASTCLIIGTNPCVRGLPNSTWLGLNLGWGIHWLTAFTSTTTGRRTVCPSPAPIRAQDRSPSPMRDGFASCVNGAFVHTGPSEEDRNCLEKMGLSKQDVADITAGWAKNFAACQDAIVKHGGFNWQLFGTSKSPNKQKCRSFFQDACTNTSNFQTSAMHFELDVQIAKQPAPWIVKDASVDVASFLLARGDYTWLGYGWMGCGCGWEDDGTLDCGAYPRPKQLDVDYGTPLGLCEEAPTGVFTRHFTMSTVSMDCNTFTPSIHMHPLTPSG
eukprot:m.284140 g.284140  ORF g.284140 m.284140 type:complete len:322 (-) comp19899_c0_seq12:227-1192(-)